MKVQTMRKAVVQVKLLQAQTKAKEQNVSELLEIEKNVEDRTVANNPKDKIHT